MSKVYAIGDLFVGMKIRHHMSDDVWEIEEISFDEDDVSFILFQSRRMKLGSHAFDRYTAIVRGLNEEYYVEVPEETFEIET